MSYPSTAWKRAETKIGRVAKLAHRPAMFGLLVLRVEPDPTLIEAAEVAGDPSRERAARHRVPRRRGAGSEAARGDGNRDLPGTDMREIPEQAGVHGVAVAILAGSGPYSQVLASSLDPGFGRLISRRDATVDGRVALVIEIEATGSGLHPAGSRSYSYLVDVGGVGVSFGTFGFTGDEFARYREAVDAMIAMVCFLPQVRPGAAARTWIEIGLSIDGISIGMTQPEVRAFFGEPHRSSPECHSRARVRHRVPLPRTHRDLRP